LLSADGFTIDEIARIYQTDRDTVSSTFTRWENAGLAGLFDEACNISTNATGEATGGNININTENLVALENSDISANAQAAFGGTINITAAGIFGTEFRPF
ncbi:helix-turn-helix domain-containing protein, partial [Okeania sp. SIO1H2]|uniref:helix-turn-helix domain-containing protein n=1 Tax=Okeania sp. SIO1H2 TaxID=2607775 RepID=UPI00141C77F3